MVVRMCPVVGGIGAAVLRRWFVLLAELSLWLFWGERLSILFIIIFLLVMFLIKILILKIL